MNPKIKALKAAFPHTIPILMGFLFLGLAYGFYMNSKGFSFWWPLLMSATIFCRLYGVCNRVPTLWSLLIRFYAFLLALMVNARHLFYGISMLERFKGTGRKKMVPNLRNVRRIFLHSLFHKVA